MHKDDHIRGGQALSPSFKGTIKPDGIARFIDDRITPARRRTRFEVSGVAERNRVTGDFGGENLLDKKVQDAPREENLESQIDSLLTQIGHTDPGDAKVGSARSGGGAAAPEPASVLKSNVPADVSGDALAEQIQDLLDDAKVGGMKDKASESVGVDRIDEALAENADKAIEGHFDTSEQAGVEPIAPAVKIESVHAAAAAEEVPGGEPDLEGAFASPEDLLKDAPKPPAPAVAVQAPSPVVAPKAATGFNADAAAVGRELDEQLQDRSAAPVARPAKTPKLRKKIDALAAVRGVFVLVNKPLLGCSASTRNTIGWIGLMTLFNGSVLLASHAIFPNTGQSSQATEVAAAAPKHEAASAKEGGEGEAKHDKAKPKHEKPKKPEKKAKKPAGGEE